MSSSDTYRTFEFKKLVRDKIVSGIKENRGTPHYRRLDEEEFLEELKKKLLEEVQEIPNAKNRNELLKELADINEIIDYLLQLLDANRDDLRQYQIAKDEKAGAFDERYYIETVDAPPNYSWIEYYEQHPEKYPEVTDE